MITNASKRLQENKLKIMAIWETRAKKEVSAALGQKSLALQNSLPEYLSQLVTALSTSIDRTELRIKFDLEESERIGRKHGKERAGNQNYTMDQMIYEYHILRQVIFDVLEEEGVINTIEREIILCSVEQAVNDAATQFSETLTDAQEKFTRALAHDLRNPITSAKMGAELILRKPEDVSHNMKASKRIVNSMERLDIMIRDLLDVSRLKAGQTIPLQFEECDLDLLAREIADEFSYQWGDRFIVQSPGPISGFWSNSGLSRVLENLITNAAKYGSPKTPITITVQKNDTAVQFSVHNEGSPIPLGEQSALFQQYRRSKSAEGKTGWGLGLTVVKDITEAHRGKIEVESTDLGTAFHVQLPNDSRISP